MLRRYSKITFVIKKLHLRWSLRSAILTSFDETALNVLQRFFVFLKRITAKPQKVKNT